MKTLELPPLTRVEGDGRVELEVGEDGTLRQVRLRITESPRLFEGLVLGRDFGEIPALVCRICAICSSVHRVTAARALEAALEVQVPPAAVRVRELLLMGGHIESHALHLFCLVLPDLAGVDSIVDLLRAGHPAAPFGLALKGLGNRIQAVAGGRTIHPINVEVGGVLHLPPGEELNGLLAAVEETITDLFPLLSLFDDAGQSASPALGTRIAAGSEDRFRVDGEALYLSGGRRVPVSRYREILGERPVPFSNARYSASPESPLLSGALARLDLARERQTAGRPTGEWPGTIFGNNKAQALELAWALERSAALVRELLHTGKEEATMAEVRPKPGVGTAATEAPRGLLIHHYGLDDRGRVAAADIVTPTAINQAAMAAQISADLSGVTGRDELTRRTAMIVRAYDPCISCSVHVLRAD